MNKQIRIIPKRREIDVERLAEALLDLVASLSPEDAQRFVAQGEQVLQQLKGGQPRRKESAA